jgi:hypothetical protein
MRGKTPDVYRRRIEEDSHDPSVCGWAMRICIMKTAIRNSIHKLWDFFADDNLNISKWDGALLGDFYSYNLSFCITAAAMLCVLSLIGLIGTYAPFSTGLIIPAINATVVYLIIFGTNACFLAALQYAHHPPEDDAEEASEAAVCLVHRHQHDPGQRHFLYDAEGQQFLL